MIIIKVICCIGVGYVGGLICSVIVLKCLEIKVIVVDLSKLWIDLWNLEKLLIFEVSEWIIFNFGCCGWIFMFYE